MRKPSADHQLYPQLFAEILFVGCVAILVDKKDIRTQFAQLFLEIHQARTYIYPCIFDRFQGLDHVKALLVGVDGFARFQLVDGLVGTEADIEITMGSGFLKKRHMPRMEHVITTRNKYFLCHCISLNHQIRSSQILGSR